METQLSGGEAKLNAPERRVLERVASWLGISLAVVACVGIAAAGIGLLHLRAAAEPARETLPPVSVATTTVKLERGYSRSTPFTGRLEAARQTAVAFERAGLVLSVTRDEGDDIEADDVIARLDTAQLVASRRQLEARRRELEAQRSLAELTRGRQSKLQSEGWSPEQRLDEAEANLAQLTAAIDQIAAQISSVDIDLEKSELKAPFAGRVAQRMVDDGAVVAGGTPVLMLLETGRRQARIGLPPALASALDETQAYALKAGQQTLEARLIARRPDIETGTRTVTALFEVRGGESSPALGDLVVLELSSFIEEPGAWVPLAALKEGMRGLWAVLVIDETEGMAKVRQETVEVLHTQGENAFVRGTIRDGDRIVSIGTDRVVAGQSVALAGDRVQ